MKTKTILTVLICIIYTISFAQSQSYYWSGGVKNYLYEDSKSMLIEVKKGENIEALKGRLMKNELIEDVMEISSRNFLLIKTKEVIDIQRISNVYAINLTEV